MKNTGQVKLDIHIVSFKRSPGKGNLITEVQELINEKAVEGLPVLLYLKDLEECKKAQKKLI